MTQATATTIAEHHLQLVTDTHNLAQRGVETCYDVSADDTPARVAAVLTALALALAANEAEIRRGDAFGGRVQLPFLLTRSDQKGDIVVHCEDVDAWLLLRPGKNGSATVAARHDGLAGLETLAVRMAEKARAKRSFAAQNK